MAKDLFPDEPNIDLFPEEANAKPATNVAGMAKDAVRDILSLKDLPEKFLKGIQSIPRELGGVATMDLKRIGQNALSATGDVGRNILQAPGNARDYLVENMGYPESTPSMRLPESILPRDFDYRTGVGIEGKEPGDELISGLTKFLVGSSFGGPVTGSALNAVGEGEGPISSAIETGLLTGSLGNLKRAPKYKRSLSQTDTAQDFVNNFLERELGQKRDYKNIFKTPDIPEESFYFPKAENLDILEKHVAPKTMKKINEHLEAHTPLDMHWAQSELGHIERGLERKFKKDKVLTGDENALLKAVTQTRKDLQTLLKDTLDVSHNPSLSEIYQHQSNKFRQEIGQPYGPLMEDIDLFRENRISAEDFLNAIRSEKGIEARHMYGHETPGIKNATETNLGANLAGQIPLANYFINKLFRRGGA